MTSAITFPAPIIGLMSGTSADGVDAALIFSDGQTIANPLASASMPYSDVLRADILGAMQGKGDRDAIAFALTQVHAQAVEAVIAASNVPREKIALIGFHGQTIQHKPDEGYTLQIGAPQWLAEQTGIPVVADFRSNDVRHGGQGAPLVPLYHAARAGRLAKPAMIVNIGGVANITWIDAEGNIEAFDCGPGNALLDDWISQHTGERCDMGGAVGKRGIVKEATVRGFLRDAFFVQNRARSLDRNHFSLKLVKGLSLEDGAATLAAITAAAIGWSVRAVPEAPAQLLITGGGRHNPTLMRMIRERAGVDAVPVETVDWNGDMLEAEAFAYLAARSVQGLPLSLPSTTGVKEPVTGGVLHAPSRRHAVG